jgi:Zn-dependent peptidase ImmA (M78 family)
LRNLFVLIFFTACSFVDEQFLSVDPRLKTPVDQFRKEARKRKVDVAMTNLTIRVGKIEESGQCIFNRNHTTITINESFFAKTSPDSLALQYIVFHELGHYIGRDHNSDFSIMNPNKFAGEYRNNPRSRVSLIDELFIKF